MLTTEILRTEYGELVDAVRKQRLWFIIGPTLSIAAGIPTWQNALDSLQVTTDEQRTPLDLINYYLEENPRGRTLLEAQIRGVLHGPSRKFSFWAELVKSFTPQVVMDITHNDLLQQTYLKAPARPCRIVLAHQEKKPSYSGPTAIVKALGSCSSEAPLVLRPTEVNVVPLQEFLQPLTTRGDSFAILIMGYDLDDPLYAAIFDMLIYPMLPLSARSCIALATEPSREISNQLDHMGIDIIDLASGDPAEQSDSYSKLLELLRLTALETSSKSAAQGIEDSPPLSYKDRLLVSRLGSGLSLQVDPRHVDNTHWYDEIFRQDLLDYPTGDFYSIRRLRGRNVSGRLSAGLTYAESSEQKISFTQTELVALDSATRRRLVVDSSLRPDQLAFTHAFTIRFPRAIAPGEEFDVVYAIRLPGELEVLSVEDEIMSISLARIQRGVSLLQFNVVLDFEPSAVAVSCLNQDGEPISTTGNAPLVERYAPREWFEEYFDIRWTASPHIIRWNTYDPDSSLYIINYRR